MGISDYQIHNVLKLFSKRLMQEAAGGPPVSGERQGIQRVHIALEGKRRSVTDTVTADILNRLTHACVRSLEKAQADTSPSPPKAPVMPGPVEFAYCLVDPRNRKTSVSMPLEDPAALIGRIGEFGIGEIENGPGPRRPPRG